MGAKPPIFIPQDQYIRKTWCVFWLLDPYIPKTYHVLHIRYPLDGIRWGVCNTSLPCYPKMWSVFKINHVPGQFPRPRQRPWFSFAFFSFIKERKEGRGMGAKPPIFIAQDQYIRKMHRVFIIHRIWISKTWCVFRLYDRYNLKNWRVLRIRHPWDDVR